MRREGKGGGERKKPEGGRKKLERKKSRGRWK